MAASHMITIEVAVPPEQAEAALYQAFVSAGLGGVGGGAGRMRGKTPMSLMSWGENVEAWISHGPRGASVRLRSECAFPTQVIDWGKNRKNVDRIFEALRLLAPVV